MHLPEQLLSPSLPSSLPSHYFLWPTNYRVVDHLIADNLLLTSNWELCFSTSSLYTVLEL